MILRLWQLYYYRKTGLSWSPSLGALHWYPTWAWVWSGKISDLDKG